MNYLIVGAGGTGVAAAYLLAQFKDTSQILLADIDCTNARLGADRINSLAGWEIARAIYLDANDSITMGRLINDESIFGIIGAVPYEFGLGLTDVAIKTRTHMCNIGGNTNVSDRQGHRTKEAKDAGITLVPDCGMAPGTNISIARYVMEDLLDPGEGKELFVYDCGISQRKLLLWQIAINFNFGGLVNEYYGEARAIREGKLAMLKCFENCHVAHVPGFDDELEAFTTSHGLSNAPNLWENNGLKTLVNYTMRRPGHHAMFKPFHDLGMFSDKPITVDGEVVVPRQVFAALMEEQITPLETDKDIGIIWVRGIGRTGGKPNIVDAVMMDEYDSDTEFAAIELMTSVHPVIMMRLIKEKKLSPGVWPTAKISGKLIVDAAANFGYETNIEYSVPF
jgi:lysine 6-dehydrogenase